MARLLTIETKYNQIVVNGQHFLIAFVNTNIEKFNITNTKIL